MTEHLHTLLCLLEEELTDQPELLGQVKEICKDMKHQAEIEQYKLERLKKKNRATEVLLEETISDLEKKHKDVEDVNLSLQATLDDLRTTQSQLIFAEKMASLGELTAGIAHEIQNPLNFVINFSAISQDLLIELRELLERKKEEFKADEYEDFNLVMSDLASIHDKLLHHGKRADTIVKSMLMHARETGGENEDIDLHKMLEETWSLAYHAAAVKHLDFTCKYEASYAAGDIIVHGNPQDISRVFLNIFGNGLDAMHEKLQGDTGYAPMLAVATTLDGETVAIRVRDNGPGIPEGIREKVFDPFFTTKPTGTGTGLGLSLSYDMIKAHNGSMRFTTEPGSFTEFEITLPVKG